MTSRSSCLSIPRTSEWVGEEPEFFEVPEYSNAWVSGGGAVSTLVKPAVRVRMETWLAFLGLYLSEGHVSHEHYQVVISQSWADPKIEAVLDNLPWRFHRVSGGWKASSVQLYALLLPLGQSSQKYVPRWVLGLSAKYLSILLDYMVLGDGSVHRNGQRTYYTSSKQLADDVQEIFQKVGSEAIIRVRDRRGRSFVGNRTGGTTRELTYEVIERRKRRAFVRRLKRTFEPYKGIVWCVTVPNHTVYVRRNGNAIWCGNCQTSVVWTYPTSSIPKIARETFWNDAFLAWLQSPVGPDGRSFPSYHGPLDLNTMIPQDGGRPVGLEWTPRHGYSAVYALAELMTEDYRDLWLRVARGQGQAMSVRSGFGYAVRVSIPPYPMAEEVDEKKHPEARDAIMAQATGVELRGPIDDPHVWWLDAKWDDEEGLVSAGIDGVVCEVTGHGMTIETARDQAHAVFERLEINNKMARIVDGADRAIRDYGLMRARGYL